MKTTLFLSLALVFLLSSCGSIGTGEFGKQKYTNFKRSKGPVLKLEKSLENKSSFNADGQQEVKVSPLESQNDAGVGELNYATLPEEVNNISSTETKLAPGNEDQAGGQVKQDRSTRPGIFRTMGKAEKNAAEAGLNDILMILLCIFLPPVAIYLVEALSTRFWVALILCLIGGGFLFSRYAAVSTLWLIAIILAFIAYLGH